jgi:glycerophosphoryl diester phosphodiesterase
MDRTGFAAVAVLAALWCSAPAAAAPGIHAHRGGSVLDGRATYPENTLPAFRHAVREGYVLELDVKLTRDGVPVVIHDATLDRTTPCTGEVRDRTRAQLASCPTDVLGSPGSGFATRPAAKKEPIPTLAQVLALARAEGAVVNLEIKNVPTDPDFDAGPGYANRIMDVVLASGFQRFRLIVQSFWPPNLEVSQSRAPDVDTSLLTLSAANDGASSFATANGYEWVSPQWPVDSEFVSEAHGMSRRVVPYTLNSRADVRQAARVGVDALITDDPLMAQRTLGLRRRQLVPDRLRPQVRLRAPRYASDAGRRRRFRVRWSGTDRGSGIARYTLDVRRRTNVSTRWKRIVAGTTRRTATFKGKAGVTYLFRLRARDRFGNLSRFDYDETAVPRDDRSGRIRFSDGWRRIRRAGAYGRTLTRARRRGPSASINFRGNRVALIARRQRRGGRVRIWLDGRRRTIRLRGRPRQRAVVYRSRRLLPRRHTLVLRSLGGGFVDVDAIGIDTGPPPPRR